MKIGFYNIQGGTGKTTIAINFAYILSQSIKTVLIDCDFFGGTVSLAFNLEDAEHNINTYLAGESTIEDIIYNYEDLTVIPTGITSDVFQYKFDIEKFNELVGFLAEEYEIIIYDLPPNITEDNIINYSSLYELINFIFLVSDDSIPSIANTLRAKELVLDLDIPVEGIIINKSQGLVDLTEISDDVVGILPYDVNVERQWTEGKPVVKIKTKFSKEIKKFTEYVVSEYLEKDLASLRALKLAKEIYGNDEELEL
ncbi:MinD/ParA family ATP-binding protein [Methanocaldococcus indicus]|uniref:MinD/ParA family ATP-binding protein n=1 Tax=Methanocaldococcus indicus TaxID=213231 RepID=UPI003C6D87C4